MKNVGLPTTQTRGRREIETPIADVKADATASTNAAPELSEAERERVGVDGARRDPIVSNAPKRSVSSMFASQVQESRDQDGLKRLAELAASLDAEAAMKTAKLLGNGTFGAAYDLGNGFVLKHFGDPASDMGPLADKMPAGTFSDMATRQVIVHQGLRDAGYACVAAAVVAGHPTFVVMQRAEGLAPQALTEEEREQARAACALLRVEIRPALNAALRAAGVDVGEDGIDTDVRIDNARFERTSAGITIASFFDPTM